MGDVAIVIELGEEQPVEAHTLEPQRKTNFHDVGGDCTLCTRRFIIKTYKEVCLLTFMITIYICVW